MLFTVAYRQILARMRHRHPAFAERVFKLNVAALSSDPNQPSTASILRIWVLVICVHNIHTFGDDHQLN